MNDAGEMLLTVYESIGRVAQVGARPAVGSTGQHHTGKGLPRGCILHWDRCVPR